MHSSVVPLLCLEEDVSWIHSYRRFANCDLCDLFQGEGTLTLDLDLFCDNFFCCNDISSAVCLSKMWTDFT